MPTGEAIPRKPDLARAGRVPLSSQLPPGEGPPPPLNQEGGIETEKTWKGFFDSTEGAVRL